MDQPTETIVPDRPPTGRRSGRLAGRSGGACPNARWGAMAVAVAHILADYQRLSAVLAAGRPGHGRARRRQYPGL